MIKQDIELDHRRHRLAEKNRHWLRLKRPGSTRFFQSPLVMIVVGILPGKDNDPGLTFRADIVALDQEALVVFLPETPAKDTFR